MARPRKTQPPTAGAEAPLAAILTFIVPGLGHIYRGHRTRGIIFMAVIALTFWGGVAIGGVKTTVQPGERTAWFMAQVCTGVHAGATLALARRLPDAPLNVHSPYVAYYPADDIAIVYTGVAGLLNVLVIFDVLSRGSPRPAVEAPPRSTPQRSSG